MSKPNIIKAKPHYWYSEDDISDLLKKSFDPNDPNNQTDVFAQTQMEHEDLLTDNFRNAIKNAVETGRTQLMPIHLHGNHWAGAIVRMQYDGQIQVIYNDPLGDALESQPNAMELVAAVQSVVEGTNIIDLRLRQQENGNDCGPFTTDNLIQLALYNGLDGLDRQAILGRRILKTPINGSASEIRNSHAKILTRLEDGHVENRTPEKLKERKSRKSDDALWGDVEKLLKLKRKISELETLSNKDEQIEILTEIGEIASSVYRKEIDKSAIRNRFSSNEQSKKNILYLDALELLVHLPSDQYRINNDLFDEALPKIISDLKIISENIEFVLSEKEIYDRVKKISLPRSNKDELLKEVESIVGTKPQENGNHPQDLKGFIASFYVPKALERMRELMPVRNRFHHIGALGHVLRISSSQSDEFRQESLKMMQQDYEPQTIDYDWNNRVDRYYFARTFAILGELSRDILCVIPDKTEQRDFFQNLKKIRNGLKKLAHIKFFSDGNKVVFTQENGEEVFFVEDLEKLNETASSFENLDANLEALQGFFAKHPTDSLDSVRSAYDRKMPFDLRILTEFRKIIEGKNYYEGELNNLINEIISKGDKVTNQEEKAKSSSTDSVIDEYSKELANIDVGTRARLSLPTTVEEINKFGKASINKIPVGDRKDLAKYLGTLNKVKDALLAGDRVTAAKKEFQESNRKYQESYEAVEDEYRYDFPDPKDVVEFEEFLSERKKEIEEKIQQKAATKTREKSSGGKYDRGTFLKYCVYFEKEAARLKSITSFILKNGEQKQRHQFAVAHSVGIIGEAIRYLFEIDDETNFLGEFAKRSLVEDINETRMVRNKQVMHGTFNYDADAVFRAATQNTTPWEHDIKAIGLVQQFLEIISSKGDYFNREAAKLGLTSDQMQMRMAMFVGASYIRLGQIDKASEVLEDAKSIALSNEGDPAVEEIIRINNLLAAIERKRGNNPSAFDLIDESLGYLEEYPQYQSEEAQLLNNKATIISEVGYNEEAKELYKKAMDQGFVPAAISLGQMLCEEKKYDEAIEIYREQFLKINPEREKRPFEFIMILRGLWLAQSESGKHEIAEKTFNNYVNFYRKNLPLFKAHCGQGYKNVEAMILHDEGSNLYNNGHYTRAINKLENALSLLDENGIRISRDISHIHLNIANSYKYLASKFSSDRSSVSDYRKMAIQHYEDAIKSSDHEQSIDVAHAHAGLAKIYANMRKSIKSNEHKKAAKDGFSKHGDIGKKYSEVLDNSTRAIEANHNSISRTREIKADDKYALFQGGLLEVGNAMKSNRNQEALDLINNQMDEAKLLGVVNPPVIQLNFQKFICHCRLGQQQRALEAYYKVHELVESHPDCADHSYRDYANRVFQSNFHSNLPSVIAPTGSIKPTNSGKLSSQSRQH
jgi:tetratricopeptide (TPR) repeat protein